jgi:hypothetical protein
MAVGATCCVGAMTVAEALSGTSHASEIVPGDVPGGPSTSQTIMIASLRRLLALVPADAPPEAYRSAVMEENVLAKDTRSGREWAFRQLRRFYSFDAHSLLFRALRDVWEHDEAGQPLLGLLCAIARDPVLRASSAVILAAEPGAVVGPSDFEQAIEAVFPGAYRESTRRASAQKVASSWAQSGHLHAERPTTKVRARVQPTPGAVAYALLLGHVQGARGQALFGTLWSQILDQPRSHLVDLAATASQQGILEFRNAGGVVEVTFHHLLRPFDGDQGTLL